MASNLTAQRVATEVRGYMAKRRLTQAHLATALNTSQASVSRRLSGEVAFDVDELATVAELLGVPLTDLLGEALLAERVAS